MNPTQHNITPIASQSTKPPAATAKLTPQQSLVVSSHRTPAKFFTPTHLSFHDAHSGQKAGSWESRKARKGRSTPKSHRVHYGGKGEQSVGQAGKGGAGGEMQRTESVVAARVKREESKFKPGLKADISFWLAITFTFGSAVWVVNGYLVWFPILRPKLATNSFLYSADATAFIGATVFEIGSYLMVVEALDRGRESNFGTALGRLLHHRRHLSSKAAAVAEIEEKSHLAPPSGNANGGTGRSSSTASSDTYTYRAGSAEEQAAAGPDDQAGANGFVWWGKPMWHDLGYVAALVQLFAATIFWVSTVTGLPGVIPGFADNEGSTAIVDVFFWTPQVIGGWGFIISSLLLMLEVQSKWYIPKLNDIGWWVGVWNLIGAFGFMLCGAFGYSPSSGMEYQSALSTFWGSWAFLLGSFCQTYETIWREPDS